MSNYYKLKDELEELEQKHDELQSELDDVYNEISEKKREIESAKRNPHVFEESVYLGRRTDIFYFEFNEEKFITNTHIIERFDKILSDDVKTRAVETVKDLSKALSNLNSPIELKDFLADQDYLAYFKTKYGEEIKFFSCENFDRVKPSVLRIERDGKTIGFLAPIKDIGYTLARMD